MTTLPKNSLPETIWAPILLSVFLIITAMAYWPGLHSGFLLDDIPNLLELEKVKNGSGEDLLIFVTEGRSGPLGRPLALASFALQADDWPGNPAAFKQVNVGIHLLNALLIYALLLIVGRTARLHHPAVLALAIAATWVALPIHVGNVLYVVQRMTLLAATFSLLGLISYAACRRLDSNTSRWPGLAAMSLLGLFTVAATLTKETGLLTIPLAALLEWHLNRARSASRQWRRSAWIGLGAILVSASGILAVKYERLVLNGYGGRDFTLLERIATQPAILVDYLQKIVTPNVYELGIFNEAFPISDTWHAITLPSLLLIFLAILAVFMIKREPLVTVGVTWFFIGHALESTVFPLELYFEHRNYLPAIGIVIAAVGLSTYVFDQVSNRLPGNWRKILPAAGLIITLAAYLMLSGRTTVLWSRPLDMAYLWSVAHPESVRARLYLMSATLEHGRYDMAEKVLADIRKDFPQLPHSEIYVLDSRCTSDALPLPDPDMIVRKILETSHFKGTYGVFNGIVMRFEDGVPCKHLELDYLESLLRDWASQEANPHRLRRALMLLARTQYLLGDLRSAIIHLDYAARISDYGSIRLAQARWLAAAGYTQDAAHYLSLARENFENSSYRPPEESMQSIQKMIDSDSQSDDEKIQGNDK